MNKTTKTLSSLLLATTVAVPSLLGQNPAAYKTVLDSDNATSAWSLTIGADPAFQSIVYIDFNGNGRKDSGEGWDASKMDPRTGLVAYTGKKSSKTLTIYGPVTTLFCTNAELSDLNTSENPELRQLAVNNNALAILDFSNNSKLERLNVSDNQLSRLMGMTNKDELVFLSAGGNANLSQLDLRGTRPQRLELNSTKVTEVKNADFSRLTAINVSGVVGFNFDQIKAAPQLIELGIEGCKLSTFDMTLFPNLQTLWAPSTEFESLDLSKNTALRQVMLSYGKLTSLDVSNSPSLRNLYLENNAISDLKLPSGSSRLRVLNVVGNKPLTKLNLVNHPNLWVLQADGSGLTSLDLSGNPDLEELTISSTEIKSLDLSKTPQLRIINVLECRELTKLDVTPLTSLENMYCDQSGLTELDLSKNTALATFSGSRCGFKSLVFNSTALSDVSCFGNSIKADEMTRLIASLPKKSGARLVAVDLSSEGMDNECTVQNVADAKAKGWTVYDRNLAGDSPKPYAGSGTKPVQEIADLGVRVFPTVASGAVTIEGAAGREYLVYSLSGELISRGYLQQAVESVPVSMLPNGSYLVRVAGVAQAFMIKVMN